MSAPPDDQSRLDAPLDDAGGEKLPEDDPSLELPAEPRRVLKPAAVALALGTLALGGLGAVAFARYRAQHPPITEEPKAPAIPRAQTVPEFLAASPATPTPMPVETRRTPAPAPLAPSAPPPLPSARALPDPSIERERAQREALDEQARGAGVFFQTSDAARAPSVAAAPNPAVPLPPPSTLAAPAGLPAALAGVASAGSQPWDPNLQDHKSAFLDTPRQSPDYLATTLQNPISPYEVKAGSIIPVTLIDGINSDLPGPVTAQVRERVFDSTTGEHLLIPQGTKLFGWYDSKVAWGQERVLLCWDRLIFPNGKSINLQCMPASDLRGQAGLGDEVDNHYDRLIAAVGLSTILAVGTQAAAGDPTGYQPTLAQTAARNAAGQINNAGQAIVSRQINIQPTITIRPGFAANLRVTKDIVLETYTP